jgi:deazaflavin-dependent oxidoreductase (nitroreductase family)
VPNASSNPWEDNLIADLRANGGRPSSGPLAGQPLLIMHSTGAKSGEPRRAILTYSRDGDDLVVAGTKSGAPVDPAWISNIRANGNVTLEVDNETFPAIATIAHGSKRDRLWERHVAELPWFAPYPETAGRLIPMVRLTPRRG